MRLNEQRTFINRNSTLRVTPQDWDTIQEVFSVYIDRAGKKKREAAEVTFRNLWGSVGETHAYTIVRPVRKSRKSP